MEYGMGSFSRVGGGGWGVFGILPLPSPPLTYAEGNLRSEPCVTEHSSTGQVIAFVKLMGQDTNPSEREFVAVRYFCRLAITHKLKVRDCWPGSACVLWKTINRVWFLATWVVKPQSIIAHELDSPNVTLVSLWMARAKALNYRLNSNFPPCALCLLFRTCSSPTNS